MLKKRITKTTWVICQLKLETPVKRKLTCPPPVLTMRFCFLAFLSDSSPMEALGGALIPEGSAPLPEAAPEAPAVVEPINQP